MPVPDEILKRIGSSQFNGQHVADSFFHLAASLDKAEMDSGEIHLTFDDDAYAPGDLVPSIIFSVTRYKGEA
jgi:hypothetical protein